MRYLDVCAGISASTVAWKPLGWEAAAYSEIEPAPRAVLAHHYPSVPIHGDFTTIRGDEYGPIDLLVGGTPCQDFSIAGLRAGLGGDRGNLSLQFLLLAARTRPRWIVWENVPGVFSSLSHDAPDALPPQIDLDGSDGPEDGTEIVVEDEYDADESHALGCFLAGLSELGYGVAYRVLDAQFAGVPQRRRRIFVVGHLGDWRCAAAVLLERHGLSGHPAPRREEGTRPPIGALAGTSPGGGWRVGADEAAAGQLIASTGETAHCLNAGGMGRQDYETETLITQPALYSIMPMNSGKDYVGRQVDVAQPLMAGGPVGGNQGGDFITQPVALDLRNGTADSTAMSVQAGGMGDDRGLCPNAIPHTLTASAVRRLTPRECERLQGFPDDYTLVPHRGKPMADGSRYKALGNSMAVPVMRWIGERIQMVDAIKQDRLAA